MIPRTQLERAIDGICAATQASWSARQSTDTTLREAQELGAVIELLRQLKAHLEGLRPHSGHSPSKP